MADDEGENIETLLDKAEESRELASKLVGNTWAKAYDIYRDGLRITDVDPVTGENIYDEGSIPSAIAAFKDYVFHKLLKGVKVPVSDKGHMDTLKELMANNPSFKEDVYHSVLGMGTEDWEGVLADVEEVMDFNKLSLLAKEPMQLTAILAQGTIQSRYLTKEDLERIAGEAEDKIMRQKVGDKTIGFSDKWRKNRGQLGLNYLLERRQKEKQNLPDEIVQDYFKEGYFTLN